MHGEEGRKKNSLLRSQGTLEQAAVTKHFPGKGILEVGGKHEQKREKDNSHDFLHFSKIYNYSSEFIKALLVKLTFMSL